jgi:hypothetical protein
LKKTGSHGLAPAACVVCSKRPQHQEYALTLCPIAIVASCAKCPAVSVCPLKTVLGDAPKPGEAKASDTKKK